MKQLLISLCFLLSGLSCKKENPILLEDVLERYHQERLKWYPVEATEAGEHRYNHLYPINISTTYRQHLSQFYTGYLEEINKVDNTVLDDNDKTNLQVFRHELKTNLALLEFKDNLMPINQFWGPVQTFTRLASGSGAQPFKTMQDYKNFISRMEGFKSWCDTAVVNMRKGAPLGFVYSKAIYDKILPQLEEVFNTRLEENIFFGPVKNIPDSMNSVDRQAITELYTAAIERWILPSYRKLYDCIKNDVMPHAIIRTGDGIDQIPNGSNYYREMVKFWTTAELPPDTIFEFGLKEVARIKEEMERLRSLMKFGGDLNAFFRYYEQSKKYKPFTTDEEVLNAFALIQKKIDPKLSSLFSTKPKTQFEIRQTETFRKNSASAEYIEAPVDGSRPGIFYVPIPDPTQYNVMSMSALFLHEAIPGHHYQISLQRENTLLPSFRRTSWYGAYGEGWALYTESLGHELGLYEDPVQYLGYLTYDIHRAIRLVVDVGLHHKSWTREQAINYMIENEPVSEQRAIAETERYMVAPGQALSYKIGQLKIAELKRRSQKILGDKFDVAEFHQIVLETGCIPLTLMEERINRWLQSAVVRDNVKN